MIPLTVKWLVALTSISVMSPRVEAADTCAAAMPCIHGLPGRDGRDGQPGRDGRDGPPGLTGTLTLAEKQKLKEEILSMVKDEVGMLSSCTCITPSQPGDQQVSSTGHPTSSILPTTSKFLQSSADAQPVTSTLHVNTRSTFAPQSTPTPEIRCKGTSEDNPAISCQEVYECNSTAPSGNYWIRNATGSAVLVYCEMEATSCGNATGWRRAVYINMTDKDNVCPQGLIYTVVNNTRMCTAEHTRAHCNTFSFPSHGLPYTKVCGRARGYQFGTTDAFLIYYFLGASEVNLNTHYVDGLSLTHGTPRNHIWTFAAGYTKGYTDGDRDCICGGPSAPSPPPFVGDNYFCESGTTVQERFQWFLDDPLWDAQGCASGSSCCDRGQWFIRTLSQETTDNIEVRWCSRESADNEDIGVEQLEILIQ